MPPGTSDTYPGRDRTTEPGQLMEVGPSGLISLHANDLDIRQALELLSRQGKLNILVSPDVGGRINVNLEGATLNQALDAILHLGNLVAKRERVFIYVYTKEEYSLVAKQNVVTRIYKLNYLRSHDVEAMIQPLLSDAGKVTATPQSLEGINTSSVLSTTAGGGGTGASGGGGVPS
jgi:type II secretory pathway component GspD/PulD (secretin)